MTAEHPVRTLADAEAEINSLIENQRLIWLAVRDHTDRFDTLQTPFWKRVWYWIDGWPWYDLNGTRRRRPWHKRAR